METMRKIVKDMIDILPEEKLRRLYDSLEEILEENASDAWRVWAEFGTDAAEGKWEDASKRHDHYLYGTEK